MLGEIKNYYISVEVCFPPVRHPASVKCLSQVFDNHVYGVTAKMCVNQPMKWYQNISLPNIGIIPKNGALIGLQFWQISPSSEIAAPAIWTHSATLQSQYHCDKLCGRFRLTSPPQSHPVLSWPWEISCLPPGSHFIQWAAGFWSEKHSDVLSSCTETLSGFQPAHRQLLSYSDTETV